METQRTTLSFLTESKSSHVSLSSFRRVAITLLVMLLTTASAIAENNYWLTLDPNYEGGASTMVPVSISANTITLTKNFEPTRAGEHTFFGWSTSSTGDVEYKTGDKVTLDGNLTLYAIWDCALSYTITDEGNKQVEVSGYIGEKPSGTLNIPATTTINGTKYSVTSIGDNAFQYCSSLQSVTIPESVTSIGNNAFWRCSNLQSVTIPESVTSIGDYAFNSCSNLQSVTIPNSVTSIGNYAFSDCRRLQSVTIPNSVTSIGNYAFSGCSSLESVTIPTSVTSIGENAFMDCGINSLTIGMNNIGSEFRDFSSLKSVTILYGTTSIGKNAFNGCVNLASVTIPNSVTSIDSYAFYNCSSLASVTIPNSVTSIGNEAFKNCI